MTSRKSFIQGGKKMKKIYLAGLMLSLSIALCACGKNQVQDVPEPVATEEVKVVEKEEVKEPEKKPEVEKKKPESDMRTGYKELDDILIKMEKSFDDGMEKIPSILGFVSEDITDYKSYEANHEKLTKAYDDIYKDAEAVYGEAKDYIVEFAEVMASSDSFKEYSEWDGAMTVLYRVWDTKSSDYYKCFDDEYSKIYEVLDDVISDAYDKIGYSKASDAWEKMYDENSGNWSRMYDLTSEGWSLMYDVHSAIWAGLFNDDSDIDALVKKAVEEHNKDKKASEAEDKDDAEETDDKAVSEETDKEEKAADNNSDEVTPEFKKVMDDYEAFYDEYCDFMKKYLAGDSDDTFGMLADYTKMLTKLQEMNESLENMDTSEMSKADQQYYIDVNARIQKKLLDVMN